MIAVVGGGPAGSLFAYFTLDLAKRMGMDLRIDLFEAKDFNCAGPGGCNNCGGIISESLVQMMATEGIVIPSNVIRRGIETYQMHLETGTTLIEAPVHEKRIAAVYRGFGPKGAADTDLSSFDDFLVGLAREKGANIVADRVIGLTREENGITVTTKSGASASYDLVVGAAGLNQATLGLFSSISDVYKPPKTTKTFICEFNLETETINRHFGDSMHVFLLNLPNIKFGALIPKNHFVTLVMLGSEINQEIARQFVQSDQVRACFPPEVNLDEITACKCFPFINVRGSRYAYDDRMVLIGDSGVSKLYKNGIGAAFITAKAAARTAIFSGISRSDFQKDFGKTCSSLEIDNRIGKLIFTVTTLIQKSDILKSGLQRQVRAEQRNAGSKRRMSSVLWDTFTGSAGYGEILARVMHPAVIASLIGNIIAAIFKRN